MHVSHRANTMRASSSVVISSHPSRMSRLIRILFHFLTFSSLALSNRNDTADAVTKFGHSANTTDSHLQFEMCNDGVDTELELQILDRLMSGYNKQMLPGKKRVQAFVEITVNDITRVSELDSFFELDMFYSELWFDPRLSYHNWPEAKCVKNITLDLDYLRRLWTPNICIVNSKSAVIHSSPSENVFLIAYQDGKVWKNCRMMLRAPCHIDLRAFPFDTQTCTLIFESYSFNSQRLTLEWFEETAITLSKSAQQLADFHLIDYRVDRSLVAYPNGQWDQLAATFVFERRYGFFIWQAFIPSYMTIFVAWITFFMDPKELATRATLGISAFLAIMLQFGQVQQNQPRVSYMKAMDVWMLGAISFLFGALAELAVISYMIRSDRPGNCSAPYAHRGRHVTGFGNGSNANKFRRSYPSSNGFVPTYQGRSLTKRPPKTESGQLLPQHLRCNCPSTSAGECSSVESESKDFNCNDKSKVGKRVGKWTKLKSMLTAYNVDKFFLIVYLPTFLVFNFIFWTYYL